MNRDRFTVERMCKLFDISRSGYYAWKHRSTRKTKSEQISERVKTMFRKKRKMYGSPRLAVELQAQGYNVSRSTVARIMRSKGLIARPRRRYVHTTRSNHGHPIAVNLLNREFTASRPNEKWVSDITYIPTRQGWTYLTVIIDLADRMVVSWSLSKEMSSETTTIKAMKIAMERRKITQPLLFHSDQGVQYCSDHFQALIKSNQWITQSMSRKGNCWDNAVAESFFKSLKTEWVKRHDYRTYKEAQSSIFDYIERIYNTTRRHSANGYLSPLDRYKLFFNRVAA